MTPDGFTRLELDEGCRLHAYPDPDSPLGRQTALPIAKRVASWQTMSGAPWTVGYGCTGPGIGPNTVWTQAQATAGLAQRVAQTEAALQHALPWFAKLDPVRQDCLVNIAFNIGVHGLLNWPVTLGAIERGDYAAAKADILSNQVWRRQVGDRAIRCANAMGSGAW